MDCLPSWIETSVAYDLKADPSKFLRPMYKMLQFFEQKGKKAFSLLPLRRGFVFKHLNIDHQTLEQWTRELAKEESAFYFDAVEIVRPKKQKQKKTTEAEKSAKRKILKRKKKTKEEMAKEKKDKAEYSNLRIALWQKFFDLRRFRISKSQRWKFDCHIKTDGVSVSALFQKARKTKKVKRQRTASSADQLTERVVVGVDPGKHSIIYMTSDDSCIGKRLQYTNVQRYMETGMTKFHRQHKQMKTAEIQTLEMSLTAVNSRASSSEGFQKYIAARSSVEDKLYQHYSDLQFRVHRWWTYRGRKRSEAKLVRNIQEKFGKDAILAYGSWNHPFQMHGLVPSPTSGMRRLLNRNFQTFDVPEHYTTKVCSKCLCGKMVPVLKRPSKRWLRKGEKRMVDVRGLRRCNNGDCAVWMNRDYNAAINIRKKLLYFLQHQQWPDLSENLVEPV
jgi:transposase